MTEFSATGLSHQFEPLRNPWNQEQSTGGSSSGSGAATAAFLCGTALWGRTPAVRCAFRPPGAAWRVSVPSGEGSAATESCPASAPWTPSAH
ncbi:MAG: hypothetical protein HQ475_14830 [SAR202 cluster bacterium]|nr:hypothetical protein [SAR202 cluster bacterium]